MSDEVGGTGTSGAAESAGGPSLREALRRARLEAAERTDSVVDLREAGIARLAILEDALRPVFASVPPEIDIFDFGLTEGARPRLFVDMAAFVEMGRDRRLYRFVRDGRHGRGVLAESEHVEPIVEAVTQYVARRLVERERLLADEDRLAARPQAPAAPESPAAPVGPPTDPGGGEAAASTLDRPTFEMVTAPEPPRSPILRALAVLGAFALGGGVGAVVVVALMIAAAKGLLPGVG